MLCPEMLVSACVNQLCADPNTVAGPLNGALYNVRDSELFGDFAHTATRRAPVLHHTGAADYFEVRHFAEVGQNFVLDPISKIGVFFLIAQILKWQYRDAFRWKRVRCVKLRRNARRAVSQENRNADAK